MSLSKLRKRVGMCRGYMRLWKGGGSVVLKFSLGKTWIAGGRGPMTDLFKMFSSEEGGFGLDVLAKGEMSSTSTHRSVRRAQTLPAVSATADGMTS